MAAPRRAAAASRAAAAPPLLALLLLLAMAAGAAAARLEPKGAKITLRAKWPGTPLLHEAAEFLADEDPALFWRFVEGWQESAGQLGASPSPEQCWAGIRSAAAPHLSAGMARLLDASLAARQYSPRLEMFRQLAEASHAEPAAPGSTSSSSSAAEAGPSPCCWALLGGRAYTAAAPLVAALEAALAASPGSHHEVEEGGAGAVYSFDHIYMPPGSSAPPLNITAPGTLPVELFAPMGARCAAELHAVLSAAATRSEAAAAAAAAAGQPAPPRLAYAWRPVLGGSGSACAAAGAVHPCTRLGTEGPLVLPGFGVELALKNMEYNAQDDSKQPAGEEKAGEEEAGDEEAAAQPEGEGGSEAEKKGAPAPASEDGVMKVKLKALGLQAAQRVLNAAAAGGNGTAALAALQEAAQDFPRLVEQLSGLKYSKTLRMAVEGLQRFIPAGSQFLILNGLVYNTREFNLYSFLDALRCEVRLYDALRATGLPPTQLREAVLLRGQAAGNTEPPRLRLPTDEFVLWVNDLERDERYASWPRELQTLLMPMYPGRLPTIARNVLTAIFLFDPAAPAALEIGSVAHQLEQQGWPVRLGLVPVVPSRVAWLRGAPGAHKHGAPSASERMGRLLSAVGQAHGATAVTQLLYELRSMMPQEEDEGADFGDRLWAQASMIVNARWDDWSDEEDETGADEALAAAVAADGGEALAAVDPAAAKLLEGAAELAYNAGLAGPSRSGVLVFNGAVTANDGSGWQGATVSALQTQLQIVQEDIYMQRLTDGVKDVHEEILRLHGAIPRYNPRIMPLDGGGPGFLRISGESEEYPARQLALTGPLLGLNGTAAPSEGAGAEGGGLWVRYFGPQPSLVDEDDEEPQGSRQHLAAVTHWVAADVCSRQGLRLVAAALQYRSSNGRLAVLVNSAGAGAAAASADGAQEQRLAPIERLLVAVSSGLLQTDLTDFADALDSMLQQGEASGSLSLEQLDELGQFNGRLAADLDALGAKLAAAAASQARFVRSALGLRPGACAVVTNGRLLELPAPAESTAGASAAAGGASAAAADAAGSEEHSLEPNDFELLELYASQHQYSVQVAALVRAAQQAGALAGADASAVAAAVSSALAAATPEDVDHRSGRVTDLVRRQVQQRNALTLPRPSGVGADAEQAHAEGSSSDGTMPPPVVVHAVLNPLSKAAQRLAPLIGFLRDLLDAEAMLLLNPQRDYEDMPLKTFYRYVLPHVPPAGTAGASAESTSTSSAAAALPAPPAAEFSGLPPNKVLTLGMDEPEPWLVEPVEAAHDLDNLRLQELGDAPAMEATYELEALMLTGMCLDLASLAARIRDQIHPRGVQLELAALNAPAAAPPLVDTLVMSNLGYFQLKSRPGLWKLRLAPGRSQQLYTIASSTGASSSGQKAEAAVAGADAHQVPVALSSFSGKHMHLFLRKDADRLTEDVLTGNATEDGSKGSLWDRVSAWRGGGSGKGGAPARLGSEGGDEGERETIHVFTVASGHMYERLQKIMILSATKRTPARIKFWFIKNYMSPQMKAFVPYMARKYDFDYEFVTYKWPSWLHKQTEKQRIIWAYKILFLDVLFPLGLKKVIFCDSDQVVRADLRELWHMDLKGAPYGYTPFCDNNRDMEGFRFWKQGFWRDHLQGRPYHISALYVVDLERFRQIAAGDRLRVMYDGLSKDPNSLSNLDQDLPNYAQHTVPIFSLPQEWLWCETWCGSETRPQAKTIDLCNNPLTKEPKLQSARRIIAEWPALNREAEEFTAAVERVQRGELAEAALMDNQSLFRVRLTPMAEGVAWSSEQAQQAGGSGGAEDGGGHEEL